MKCRVIWFLALQCVADFDTLPAPIKYETEVKIREEEESHHEQWAKLLDDIDLKNFEIPESEADNNAPFNAALFKPMYAFRLRVPGLSDYWTVMEPYSLEPLTSLRIPAALKVTYNGQDLDLNLPAKLQGVTSGGVITVATPDPAETDKVYPFKSRKPNGQRWYTLKTHKLRSQADVDADAAAASVDPEVGAGLRAMQSSSAGLTNMVASDKSATGLAMTNCDETAEEVAVDEEGRMEKPSVVNYVTARDKNVIEQYLGVNVCDLVVFGPNVCEPNDPARRYLMREYVRKRAIVFAVVMVAFGSAVLLLQIIMRFLHRRLMRKDDKFMLLLLETTFRTLSMVAIGGSLIKLVFSWDFLQEEWEYSIFHRLFLEMHVPIPSGEVLNNLVNVFLVRVDDFVLLYGVFGALFTTLAHMDFVRLREADEIALIEAMSSKRPDLIDFFVARYEYKDRVNSRMLGGLDHPSCWFVEYFHAGVLQTSREILRLPISTLILFLAGIGAIFPLYRLYRLKALAVVMAVALLAPGCLTLVFIRLLWIKRQMLPVDVDRYCLLRFQLDHGMGEVTETQLDMLAENLPRYRLGRGPRQFEHTDSAWWKARLYGTMRPTRHDQLFLLGRRGPGILFRLVQGSYLLLLCVCSYVLEQLDSNARLWTIDYGFWPLIMMALIIAYSLSLLPTLLHTLTLVTYTGMRVDDDMLIQVVQQARTIFITKLTYFLDGIRCQAMLWHVIQGGPELWERLHQLHLRQPLGIREDRHALWLSLTCDTDGVMNDDVIKELFLQQGVNLGSKKAVFDWLRLFRTKTFSERQFNIMLFVIHDMLSPEGLDHDTMRDYLINKIDIDPIVEWQHIQMLAREVGDEDQWSRVDCKHLIAFLAGNPHITELSIADFINAVVDVDRTTIGALGKAAKHVKDSKIRVAPLPDY
ncbi:putative transmembrane protein [Gregarina niphandrodes]|uniref:Transmembrane protein n=1 Tax=Gregarina niphandrodes TaxID=110365 RepID=A0A023BCV9_GRENI|nr:putative transmembrane protein [Gregarina niphandrodes]EZG86500.1 putative transmembrane protein [Gregarina niphandrodes]|eukprot:XP_011128757.1 putative transmembrane protein [Gregarina niphandrodes]